MRIVQKFPIIILGNIQIKRRIYGGNLEYKWFYKRYKEFHKTVCFFVGYLPELETRTNKKKLIIKHEKKRFSKTYIAISISVVKIFSSNRVSLWYLLKSIKLSPTNFLRKQFYKAILINILIAFGIYKLIYKLLSKK